MTQCQQVLAYMRQHGGITQQDATNYIGCTRLAARIDDLKKQGHKIDADTVSVRTRDGRTARIAKYSLTPAHVGLSSSPTVAATPDQQGGLFDYPPSRESFDKTGRPNR